MTSFLQLITLLILILIAAKLGGSLSKHFNQPAVLGEILVGILLGPTCINLLHLPFIQDSQLGEVITFLADIGTLILMFLAGMELHVSDLKKNLRPSLGAGIGGDILSVLLGMGAGMLSGMNISEAIFLGLTIAATSVSISVQTLIEFKALKTRVGLTTLGAAVIDDIFVIVLLAIYLAVFSGGSSFMGLALIGGRILLYAGLGALFGLWVLPHLSRWSSALPISQSAVSFGIVIMLGYGLAAEVIGGMAAITGAFFAGLMFNRIAEKSQVEPGMVSLGYGLFIPIFFVNIGLSVQLRAMTLPLFGLLIGLILASVAGKVVGAGAGVMMTGISFPEALRIGVGMIPRGEVTLIVAAVGLAHGYLSQNIFSVVVAMLVITAIITPPLMRTVFQYTHRDLRESDERR